MRKFPRDLAPNTDDLIVETEQVARERYQGFGADLFPRLYAVYPALQGTFRFFRDVRTQSNDLWSYVDVGGKRFVVQLDPDIEVICVRDLEDWIEIGTWEQDPVAAAIRFIQERYLQ